MSSTSAVFATTHWTLVLAAGCEPDTRGLAALEQLCQAYWYPLYAYVRRRGYGVHDAQDLTQGFFTRLLETQCWERIERGKGRFRSYLLTALSNYLSDEHDRRCAQKRGGGRPCIPLEIEEAERRYQLEPQDGDTPERLFDRRWAIAVTDQALSRLEAEYRTKGRQELFARLHGCLTADRDAGTYAAIAASVGLSEEAVRKEAQRLRKRYREMVRDLIACTVNCRSEIDEEMRCLRAALERG